MGKKTKKGVEPASTVQAKIATKTPTTVTKAKNEKDKKLGEKNLDEFMNDWDKSDDDSDDDSDEGSEEGDLEEGDLIKEKDEDASEADEDEADDESEEEEVEVKDQKKTKKVRETDKNNMEGESKKKEVKKASSGAKDQKSYISKLKEKDPEFFEFLKENDQELLNFDESSDEEEEKEKMTKKHELPDKLEVASDESDFEDDEVTGGGKPKGGKVTKTQVDSWARALADQPTHGVVQEVLAAFK